MDCVKTHLVCPLVEKKASGTNDRSLSVTLLMFKRVRLEFLPFGSGVALWKTQGEGVVSLMLALSATGCPTGGSGGPVRREGMQLTGLIAAPFSIVAPFRVGSPTAIRETAQRRRVPEQSSGTRKSRQKRGIKGKEVKKARCPSTSIRAKEGKADRPHRATRPPYGLDAGSLPQCKTLLRKSLDPHVT